MTWFKFSTNIVRIPSDWICADESISQLYGLGGYWISIDLPMYIAIVNRKP